MIKTDNNTQHPHELSKLKRKTKQKHEQNIINSYLNTLRGLLAQDVLSILNQWMLLVSVDYLRL